MSWPDDGRPRFIVETVTGYSLGGVSDGPATFAYVLDRAYCHQIVAEFRTQHGGFQTPASERIRLAEELARTLNRADREDDGEG